MSRRERREALERQCFQQRPGTAYSVSVFLCPPHACPTLPIRLRRTATTTTDLPFSLTSGLTCSPRRCWLPGYDVCEAAEGLRGRSDGQAVGSHHPHERAALVNHAGKSLVTVRAPVRELCEECQPRRRYHYRDPRTCSHAGTSRAWRVGSRLGHDSTVDTYGQLRSCSLSRPLGHPMPPPAQAGGDARVRAGGDDGGVGEHAGS